MKSRLLDCLIHSVPCALGAMLIAAPAASQQILMSKADAEQAAAVITRSGEVRLFCADCRDPAPRLEKVGTVELKPAGGKWVIQLNGKPADPANIYFRDGDTWRNLAIRQSLLRSGPPATLAAQDAVSDCTEVGRQARQREVTLAPPSSYQVIGTGRLPFHTAPDAACRDKQVFVIPGDKLAGYTEYQGWTSVMYLNPASGKSYNGWVETKRLQFAGTLAPGPASAKP